MWANFPALLNVYQLQIDSLNYLNHVMLKQYVDADER